MFITTFEATNRLGSDRISIHIYQHKLFLQFDLSLVSSMCSDDPFIYLLIYFEQKYNSDKKCQSYNFKKNLDSSR